MLSKLLVALAAVAAPAVAGAQASSTAFAPPQVIQEVSRQDKYPAPRIAFANGVTGVPDLIYSQPSGFRPLVLDLYLPPKTLAPAARRAFRLSSTSMVGLGWPAIGIWNRPFVDFPNVLARLSARGYVVASVEYRLSGEVAVPGSDPRTSRRRSAGSGPARRTMASTLRAR